MLTLTLYISGENIGNPTLRVGDNDNYYLVSGSENEACIRWPRTLGEERRQRGTFQCNRPVRGRFVELELSFNTDSRTQLCHVEIH